VQPSLFGPGAWERSHTTSADADRRTGG
jgi:hypothetical protein